MIWPLHAAISREITSLTKMSLSYHLSENESISTTLPHANAIQLLFYNIQPDYSENQYISTLPVSALTLNVIYDYDHVTN